MHKQHSLKRGKKKKENRMESFDQWLEDWGLQTKDELNPLKKSKGQK